MFWPYWLGLLVDLVGHGWRVVGHALLHLRVVQHLIQQECGLQAAVYSQVLKGYLMPLKGIDWFGLLVSPDLITCVTTLLHLL